MLSPALFLFLGSFLISAQQMAPLQEYLKATPEQWEQLHSRASDFWSSTNSANRLLNSIHGEISEETLKPTINPSELGQRYRQIEELCRGVAPVRAEIYRQQMQVLNAEQRELLPALAESTKLIFVRLAAQELLLLSRTADQQTSSLQDGTPFETPAFYFDPEFGAQKVPQDLVDYLRLTVGQQDQIRQLHLRYRESFDATYARMKDAAARIEREAAQETPSAEKLGSDYAAIETARREIAGWETVLRRELSAILSQQQRDFLAALDGVEERSSLAATARNLFLFAPEEHPRPASTAEVRFVFFGTPFSQASGTSIGNSAADTTFRYCKGLPVSVWIGNFANRGSNRTGSR